MARLIAELDSQGRKSRAVNRNLPLNRSGFVGTAVPGGDWPSAELCRLIAGGTKSHSTVFEVLDLLARHPGERLSTAAICAATGLTRDKLRGAFAGLTRLVKADFAYAEIGLPLNRLDNRSPGGETQYWLSVEQAGRWKEARQGASGPDAAVGTEDGL